MRPESGADRGQMQVPRLRADKLLTKSGQERPVERSEAAESPRKMSCFAGDRRSAKSPFAGSNPTRASNVSGEETLSRANPPEADEPRDRQLGVPVVIEASAKARPPSPPSL